MQRALSSQMTMTEPTCRPAILARLRTVLGIEGFLGLALLTLLITAAVLAPALAPYDPDEFIGRPLEHPSAAHRLGTNDAGQDILSSPYRRTPMLPPLAGPRP